MIFVKIVKYPAPSSCADSSRLSGSPFIYVRITSILNALIIPGITYTQKLFVNPSPLYSKNVGIIPPFTYIVITQKRDSCFLNKNLFLLTINASIALVIRAANVPISVRATVI